MRLARGTRRLNYDPGTGQFLTRDPLTIITQSPYVYATGNPLNADDPSGLICWKANCLLNDLGAVIKVGARAASTKIRQSPVGMALDLGSQITGKTVGVCVGGDLIGGIDVNGNLCYMSTPSGEAGLTFSAGVGVGLPIGAGELIGPSVSNAQNLNDLSGWFNYAWGSVGEGPASGGALLEWGKNSCGRTIVQGTAGWSPSLQVPLPASAGGGMSYTWTAASY